MAKKWIALNILLLLAVYGLSREFYQQYEQFRMKDDPANIESVSGEIQTMAKNSSGTPVDTFMETPIHDDDYFIISENTLFSDLRGLEMPGVSASAQPVAPLNPKPVLVGTIMIDGQYTASVVDPATQQARGGQINPETRRVGDIYRGYQITSIEAEQMILENSGRQEIIPLNRTARRQQIAARPTMAAAARVIPIGPGGGSSGAISVTMAGGTPGRATGPSTAQTVAQTAAKVTAQNAAQTAAKTRLAQQVQQASQAGTQLEIQSAQPEIQLPPSKPAQKTQPGTGAQSPQGQRTVRSPFGVITRPDLEQ